MPPSGADLLHKDVPGYELVLSVDRRRILQILVNLLDNAIKFTGPGGSVQLSVRVHEAVVEFSIEDTGIGIAEVDRDRLFKPFSQVESATNRKFQGVGLGLYPAQRLAALHAGHIAVRSTPGVGTCFTLSCLASLWKWSQPVSARILIVDDDASACHTLEALLSPCGFLCRSVDAGEAALQHLEAHPTDLVIADAMMPVLDGFELCRRIRRMPPGAVPLVIVTALDDEASMVRAWKPGLTSSCLNRSARPVLRASASSCASGSSIRSRCSAPRPPASKAWCVGAPMSSPLSCISPHGSARSWICY